MPVHPTDGEFDTLPADADADADDDARRALAERMAPHVRRIRAEHPEVTDMPVDAPHGARSVARVAAAAVQELYNPAQTSDPEDPARR